MFTGDYNFFDYKYNIVGYTGQDYGGFPQKLYLIISFILIVGFLILLRKLSKERVKKIILGLTIFLILFYIIKTSWESFYDIKYNGSFNYYLLPFDTCSFVMLFGLISSFAKGKLKEYSDAWLTTGCIIGGFANMLFLNAFKFYPFLSFGAFYSMIWHLLMVFMGLVLIVTNYVDINYKTLLKGFVAHLAVSLIVIPINYIFDFDFMLYKDLGGVPIFGGIADKLSSMNLKFLNPFLMLALYFVAFHIPIIISIIIKRIIKRR